MFTNLPILLGPHLVGFQVVSSPFQENLDRSDPSCRPSGISCCCLHRSSRPHDVGAGKATVTNETKDATVCYRKWTIQFVDLPTIRLKLVIFLSKGYTAWIEYNQLRKLLPYVKLVIFLSYLCQFSLQKGILRGSNYHINSQFRRCGWKSDGR